MVLVVSSQPNKTFKFFLSQNYIKLESNPFRTRPLDFLVQNIELFTTPKSDRSCLLACMHDSFRNPLSCTRELDQALRLN